MSYNECQQNQRRMSAHVLWNVHHAGMVCMVQTEQGGEDDDEGDHSEGIPVPGM